MMETLQTGTTYVSTNTQVAAGESYVEFAFNDVPVKHLPLYYRFLENGTPIEFDMRIKASNPDADKSDQTCTRLFNSAGGYYTKTPFGFITIKTPLTTFAVYIKNNEKHKIIVSTDIDCSMLTMENYARAEIWMDYTGGKITWPSNLVWSTLSLVAIKNNEPYAVNGEPEWVENTRYFISLVNDGDHIVAKVTESYTLPAKNAIVELDSNPVINESNEAESDEVVIESEPEIDENNGVEPESDLEDSTPSE